MKPMQIAMALLSAVMFFILAGVFMGVQLELNGTKLVVDTAADIRWQWIFIGTAVVFFFQLLRPLFQKAVKNVSGPKFIMPAIDGSTVKQKLFLIALLVIAVAWPFMVSRGTVDIATLTMIYIILGLGLNVVVGLSGLLVLGYGGFYAIGAYTFALLNHYYGLGFWTCLPLAGLVSAAAGFLLTTGIVYGLAGVHLERPLLWCGLLAFAGYVALVVWRLPYAWTMTGALMATCLLLAAVFAARARAAEDAAFAAQ